jgi:TusA-related sulfurtransferase
MTIIEVRVRHTVDLRRLPAWLVERGLDRAMVHCRPGDIVEAWSTDASARDAISSWVAAAGHRLIGIETRDGYDESFVEAGC